MSRALVVRALSDDLSTLKMEDRALPAPGRGELKVRLRAASVNFPDILMVQGKYQLKPELPFSPGMEGAGDVVAVGDGVARVKMGDKVVFGSRFGCYAEEIVVPEAAVRALPRGFDYAKGAAYPAAYLTAYVGLVRRGTLLAGETLLVHGAAGGVGLAAVDLGKLLGATVIATASSDEKRAFLTSYGADHVLPSSGFREAVKDLTQGRGADVIYDPVGGDVFDESVRCIAFGGRLLVIGFTSGRIPTVSVNMPLIKGFSVVGVRAGEYGRQFPAKGVENIRAIDAWAAEGKIRPHVCAALPLERALEAMAMLQNRKVIGKVVLTM
ncbi:MAG: NADPH:quinone oxidoreductase family protein [Alphaproteobacteria bacterium]|nr:NADPH:quinone oxidoreductase family protein [Alphaproteobacteria bacterium]